MIVLTKGSRFKVSLKLREGIFSVMSVCSQTGPHVAISHDILDLYRATNTPTSSLPPHTGKPPGNGPSHTGTPLRVAPVGQDCKPVQICSLGDTSYQTWHLVAIKEARMVSSSGQYASYLNAFLFKTQKNFCCVTRELTCLTGKSRTGYLWEKVWIMSWWRFRVTKVYYSSFSVNTQSDLGFFKLSKVDNVGIKGLRKG